MDYLCELPNDAARRKALKDLPRGLKPTYERLLRRVNESNEEVQKLVQRTLKWIAHDKSGLGGMNVAQLCEAISINLGDECMNFEAIANETEILRNCSSLVRLSADGRRFEFAHFTVQEFLKNLDGTKDGQFVAYQIDSDHIETELSKVCLTHLNFHDFDKGGNASEDITNDRFSKYPLRQYIVCFWRYHAQSSDWSDTELLSLGTQFFHPSKPNTLISWAQNHIPIYAFYDQYTKEDVLAKINRCIAEASALHLAAMYGLSEVCKWLIKNGCEVNRMSVFGTPLHCAQLSSKAFCGSFDSVVGGQIRAKTAKKLETIDFLLNAGADPNINYPDKTGDLSPLFLAADGGDLVTTKRLLQMGSTVDDRLMNLLIEHKVWGEAYDCILGHASDIFLEEDTRARTLQDAIMRGSLEANRLLPLTARLDDDQNDLNRHNEDSLRIAAKYGQIHTVLRLIDDHGVDIDAAEAKTLLTALHYASKNDHVEVVQNLLKRGASPGKVDCSGRNALHHCAKWPGCRCLSLFLSQGLDTTVMDDMNLTVWHLALENVNIQALKILISQQPPASLPNGLKGNKQRPLISAASQTGSAEAVSLLLNVGCSVFDLDLNGCNALHHAAQAGSPEVIRLLVAQGVSVSARTIDGSSPIHYATRCIGPALDKTLKVLLEYGGDPFIGREDGITPMQLLVSDETDGAIDSEKEKALQRFASLLETYSAKRETLAQTLNVICQLPSSQHSPWLVTALKILLQNGVDLMSKTKTGQTAIRALFNSWQAECLEQGSKEGSVDSSTASDQMVLTVLEHVPTQGPLHEICGEPGILLSAIRSRNDQLIFKLLDHSPDVDKIIDDRKESPIQAACQIGCSRRVLRKLLERSKALSDKALGAGLVREAC